jgi:CBS domain-containing protein
MFSRSVRSLIEPRRTLLAAPHCPVSEAAQRMAGAKVGAMLVVEGERLVGIFTERDALFRVLAAGRDPGATTLREVMTPQPKTISPDKTFGHAMLLMHEGGFRHLPVVEGDKLMGIVSARDALDPELEEFVFEERRRRHLEKTR